MKRERRARTFRRLRVPIPGTRGVPGGVGAVRGGGYNELDPARGGLEGETALRSELFSDRRRGADRWSGARLRRNALSSRNPTDYIPQSYRCGTRLGLANMIYFIKIGAKTWDPGAVPASALSLVGFFGGACRSVQDSRVAIRCTAHDQGW